MGRKAKPRDLHIFEGNPSHLSNKQLAGGVHIKAAAPPMPEWLPPIAKRLWQELVPELVALGVVCELDMAILACYCWSYSEMIESGKILRREGMTVKAGRGEKAHPAFKVGMRAMANLLSLGAELGLPYVQGKARGIIPSPTP
jgi:P27 family predicted phage terminase small subunit